MDCDVAMSCCYLSFKQLSIVPEQEAMPDKVYK